MSVQDMPSLLGLGEFAFFWLIRFAAEQAFCMFSIYPIYLQLEYRMVPPSYYYFFNPINYSYIMLYLP